MKSKKPGGKSRSQVSKDAKDEEDDNDDDPDPHPGHKGKLQMDATVCGADIKYPTDLDLLNESRQKAEELIDELCLKLGIKDKPPVHTEGLHARIFFECVENEEKTCQHFKTSDTQADQLPETGCADYQRDTGHHKG